MFRPRAPRILRQLRMHGARPDPFAGLEDAGHAAIDIAARLVGNMRDEAVNVYGKEGVQAHLKPGDLAAKFPKSAPVDPVPMEALLRQFEADIVPGCLLWQHPKFMGFYPANSSSPVVVAEALTAAVNSVGLQWASNPIAAELEVVVMDWLCEMIGGEDTPFMHASQKGGGLLQSVAGEAVLNVMLCARIAKQRELAPPDEGDPEELFYRDSSKLVVYFSSDAHFCIQKAARTTGMRSRKVPPRWCETKRNLFLHPEDLQKAVEADVAAGLTPAALFLVCGSTNTCAFDPVGDFKPIAEKHGMWLHVDAAYAGPSFILPEFQQALARPILDAATSFNFNGSKWFLCGMDSAFLFVRDKRLLTQAHSASASYMASAEDGVSIYAPELKDWGLFLGRKFRALRIYMVLSYFGVSGLQAHLRHTIALAQRFSSLLDRRQDLFRQPVATTLGLICFQVLDANGGGPSRPRTLGLVDHLKNHGGFFLLPSELQGEAIVRVALGGALTEAKDVEQLFDAMMGYFA
eukprot:TRINITY_DN30348_c0_g1_i1.p1 TRINITY_DN30348_c0_g1~~TRINITY_DN30348_c0_g1_i1.p1  ORF type:complete len:519 (+),score=194.56 TRINITY_DN30348_c0_g1_i1:30-1586(+)